VKQVVGTAQYTTDIPPKHMELKAALVVSTIPHGKIKSIGMARDVWFILSHGFSFFVDFLR
jgi:CO/xanthine dehydrogenase Mo-binding subunit